MPPVTSRRGRRISSKACDSCRDRKVQCVIDDENQTCRRCTQTGTGCTFLKERKARGPVARNVSNTISLPVGELFIEHFCPRDVFLAILDDYMALVWPLLPLVHVPNFTHLLSTRDYARSPASFRLCLTLCAVTVASLPRKFKEYGGSQYSDVAQMVDRACHLVLLSRIQSLPDWQNRPSMDNMIVSLLLCMASHYAGRHNQGWSYASEAIQFFQALELYRKEGYKDLSVLEEELCKRSFWVLYIIQIHDRLSFMVPHTGLSFNPLHTDWEYLIPAQREDEDFSNQVNLGDGEQLDNGQLSLSLQPLPIIAGFIALVKVFLCVVDFLSNGFPGAPPQAYAMTSGSLQRLIYPESSHNISTPSASPGRTQCDLNSLLHILRRLQDVLTELPLELKIPGPGGTQELDPAFPEHITTRSNQFDIMRANIHVTSLYIQSKILEACLAVSAVSRTTENSAAEDTTETSLDRSSEQLWDFRISIAHELLQVLHFCSSRTLEANGASMIVKIREIAATLLDVDSNLQASAELEDQFHHYVVQFADILADLDHLGYATVIPPIFSNY